MNLIYTPGDIVIGKFPFTDKEDYKIRNFLIVAVANPFYWGVMLSKIDSIGFDDGTAYQINSKEVDFTFPFDTGIRMNVIQTFSQSVIHKKLGRLNNDAFERVLDFIMHQFPKQ